MFVVLFEDTAATLGILAAMAGVFLTQVTGEPRYDAGASVVIGLILGATALWLALETKGLLIGESADPRVVQGIRAIARDLAGVRRVNEILTMHVGPEFILVNLSVEFEDEVTVPDLERLIAGLDQRIKEAFPRVRRVFIEAESMRQAVSRPRRLAPEDHVWDNGDGDNGDDPAGS